MQETEAAVKIEQFIRDVPDFPVKGVIFKDITPLMGNHKGMKAAVRMIHDYFKDRKIDYVVGIESRGFIFGSLLADRLGAGFVPVRKPGKLPYKTISKSYSLEYGTNTIEIHTDAIPAGARVLMMDDLLATGGTMAAACELVRQLGGHIVGVGFVIELCFLPGRAKLEGYDVHSLIKVE